MSHSARIKMFGPQNDITKWKEGEGVEDRQVLKLGCVTRLIDTDRYNVLKPSPSLPLSTSYIPTSKRKKVVINFTNQVLQQFCSFNQHYH